jgi:hypothetical protein
MALITVLGIDIADMAWSGMELRTAVERTSPTSPIKEGGTPTRKVFINRGDKGKTVRHVKFVRGKRETKVSLREGGNGGAKASRKLTS